MQETRKGRTRMNDEIAQRLADMRREHGYSQEALAAELGLSRQAVSKWERGESQPDTANLIALADLYDVTLDELIRPRSVEEETAEVTINISTNGDSSDEVTIETPTVDETVSEPTSQPAASVVEGSDASSSQTAYAVPEHPGTDSQQSIPEYQQPGQYGQPPYPPYQNPPKRFDPLKTFPYPVLVVIVYLIIGMFFGWWHPGWIIFFTIPFYYWIVKVINDDPEYRAARDARYGMPPENR